MLAQGMSILHDALVSFFNNQENYNKLTESMKSKNLPPRLLDFFVTQFCKNEPIFIYITPKIHNIGIIDIYTSYKLQLKSFHKKNFNLFEKKPEVRIENRNKSVLLSLPKINVYKWLIENDILSYIQQNQKIIQSEYYKFRKHTINKNKTNSKRRGKMTTFLKTPIILKSRKKI